MRLLLDCGILIAQAKSESLTFVTRDNILKNYPVAILEH